MIRTAWLSLALGFSLLVLLLALLTTTGAPQEPARDPLVFAKGDISAAFDGTTLPVDTGSFRLDEHGGANFTFPVSDRSLQGYSFMLLKMSTFPEDLEITLYWATSEQEHPREHLIETRARDQLWIATQELPGWSDELQTLGLRFRSSADASLQVEELRFISHSLGAQVASLLNEWTGFAPWQRDSMNNYAGVTKLSQFYPAPLAGALLALSMVIYAGGVLLRTRRLAIDWRVVGTLALLCWLLLDLPWQFKLLRQLGETHSQFAGKADAQKLAAGPDAAIYQSVATALQHIHEDEARIFIASADDYTGLRAAYYFYPHNVFWHFHGRELPYKKYLRPGDYIFIARPSKLVLDTERGRLVRERNRYDVEVLTDSDVGSLLRLRSL